MAESDMSLLALHGLRLKGFAETKVIADFLGASEEEVNAALEAASAKEFTMYRDGARSGWMMTAEGRSENERLLSEELDALGQRETVQSCYERFLALNGRMLAVCTNWQVKDADAQVMNDHSDPAYDASVISDLEEIDLAVQPICAELGQAIERYANYGPRFDFALDKLRGGDNDWFTKPIIESYHTVWFELHEDLLATLGIDRASENH